MILRLRRSSSPRRLRLALGEVRGIFQPDEPRLVHQRLVLRPLLANLVASDLVERLHQVTHDVELVEHQYRLGRAVFDDLDVGLPHVAANAFNGSRFLRPQELEERLQCRLRAPLAAPQQALVLEVIDVGHVDMTALSRDLINADVGHWS